MRTQYRWCQCEIKACSDDSASETNGNEQKAIQNKPVCGFTACVSMHFKTYNI